MSKFILATRQTQLDGERAQLRDAIQNAGHTCTVVNPNMCVYEFIRGKPAVIRYDHGNLALADYLIARSTAGCRPAAYLLAQTLNMAYLTNDGNCHIVDPVSRYQTDIGKMETTVNLHRNGRGIDTWCVFSDIGLDQIINELPYPVIVKPHDGSHGRGCVVINTPSLLRHHAMSLLGASPNYPVYIQRYMKFDREYRVLCCNFHVIGIVERNRSNHDFMRSSKVMTEYNPLSEGWIPEGIVGVDVGVCGDERYIIEINYAPEWRHFEDVTRINVSKKIVEILTR